MNISNDNIINIEDNTEIFEIQDIIYISINIENQQTDEKNQNILLTDYIDLSQDASLYTTMVLYKETSFGTLSKIPLTTDNLVVLDGAVTLNDEYLSINSDYNDNGFSCEFGIKLLETGTFYLANSSFNETNDGKIYINGGSNNKGYITIISKISNSNEQHAYKIIVN